jgi:endonuclease YncB( thermonuclease family)
VRFDRMKAGIRRILSVLAALFYLAAGPGSASDKVVVAEVPDAGVFRTTDGRVFRLACVTAPSVRDPDPVMAAFGRRVRREVSVWMRHGRFRIELEPFTCEDGDTLTVHAWRSYDPDTKTVNRRFLENGFGFFSCDSCGIGDSAQTDPMPESGDECGREFRMRRMQEYRDAAEKAFRERKGLWNSDLYGKLR